MYSVNIHIGKENLTYVVQPDSFSYDATSGSEQAYCTYGALKRMIQFAISAM